MVIKQHFNANGIFGIILSVAGPIVMIASVYAIINRDFSAYYMRDDLVGFVLLAFGGLVATVLSFPLMLIGRVYVRED